MALNLGDSIRNQPIFMHYRVVYRHTEIRFNEMQFSRLIEFALELAVSHKSKASSRHTMRFKEILPEFHKSSIGGIKGKKGFVVDKDFPETGERKFWSWIFLDVSRGIFDQTLGVHNHRFWQAKAIYQSYAVGKLFEASVRESEPRWSAETIDRKEFADFVKSSS